ncbi:unnamed protein product [Clonostachys rosea f. rosea IK726]|uniref:Uncharacterized protein n=1 Tax=Clonostachys rosea f. rosea IK726 TaxID=1349383 RepID=A0ACA9TCX5_BIOOC|nr:unnamed protein product [Clonostachys rosea f. rosea IK726]
MAEEPPAKASFTDSLYAWGSHLYTSYVLPSGHSSPYCLISKPQSQKTKQHTHTYTPTHMKEVVHL